jgi:hypothetical protein
MPGAFCGPDDGRQGRGLSTAFVPSAPPGIEVLGGLTRFSDKIGAEGATGAEFS